jgi:hypothetical protein
MTGVPKRSTGVLKHAGSEFIVFRSHPVIVNVICQSSRPFINVAGRLMAVGVFWLLMRQWSCSTVSRRGAKTQSSLLTFASPRLCAIQKSRFGRSCLASRNAFTAHRNSGHHLLSPGRFVWHANSQTFSTLIPRPRFSCFSYGHRSLKYRFRRSQHRNLLDNHVRNRHNLICVVSVTCGVTLKRASSLLSRVR